MDNADIKLNSAKTHRDNTKQALDNAIQALDDLNASFENNQDNFDSQISDELKNSLISKLSSDIVQAQTAYDEANTAYFDIEDELIYKRETLNSSADYTMEIAQDAVAKAKDLNKLSDMLAYIDTANKENLNATISKNDAINAKDLVLAKIVTLPTASEIQAEEDITSNALSSTQTSVTNAINAINAASTSDTVNADDVGNISMSANNLKSSNTTVLENAQTFNTKVTEGEYKTTLDEASSKVTVALNAKNTAEVAKNNAELAMTNMNILLSLFTPFGSESESETSNIIVISDGGNFPPSNETSESESGESTPELTASIVLDPELIALLQAKLQNEYNSAKAAYDDAKVAYDDAKADYDNKNSSLNNAATNSVSNAQTAVNESNLLEDLSGLLTSLENTKEAKINVLLEKDKVVDAKAQTVSANTSASNANSNILAFKTDAAEAKADSLTASSESTAASLIANNVETENVQIAYSAKIANDKVSLAKNKADQASAAAANASTQYDNLLAFTNTMNSELSKSLTAKDKAYTNYQTAITQLAIAKAKKIEIDAVSNSAASTAALNAVTKAQALHDLALQSYNDANQLYTDTKQIVDDLNIATYLANAETKKNKANSDAAEAQAAYDTAIVEAAKADTSSKQASLRVKDIILSPNNSNSFVLGESESSLDLVNKTFKLSDVETNKFSIPDEINSYSGHTQLGAFYESENSINPTFLVQADNKQEFFVGYSDSSNVDKNLFTYSTTSSESFLADKIYLYKNFKTLTGVNSGSKTLKTEDVYYFYNSRLNSFTALSKDFYKTGAQKFVYGDDVNSSTIENVFDFKSEDENHPDDIKMFYSNGTNDFQGSLNQGLTSRNDTVERTYSYENEGNEEVNLITETPSSSSISASYLESIKDDVNSVEDNTMNGYVNIIHQYSKNDINSLQTQTPLPNFDNPILEVGTINIHTSQNGKDINSYIYYSNTNLVGQLRTRIDSKSGYYINSDIFGGLEVEAMPSGNGQLMAVPDGGYNSSDEFVLFDENDNPMTSNDDSSWGYWSAKDARYYGEEEFPASINSLSTWVAGVETSTSYIQALIDGASQRLTFHGKVLGTVGNSFKDPIVLDSTNKVRLDFDVGGGSANLTGNMQFKSENSALFNVNMNADNLTNSGYSGSFTKASDNSALSGSFEGKYYGSGSLKSLGGKFNVSDHGTTANGVFKATKK